MDKKRITDLEQFTVDFGKILLRHQREAAEVLASPEESDQNAQDFARYLRAARANAELTPTELASRADIPEATLYGLERALIYSKTIEIAHLQRLAEALDEDVETFGLILERNIPTPNVVSVPWVSSWLSIIVPKVANQIAQNVILKRIYLFALLVSDTMMLVIAFALAYWLRFEVGIALEIESDYEHYWQILPTLLPLWLLLFFLSGLYNFRYLLGGTQEYSRVFNACMSGMMLVLLATFIQSQFDVARAWLLMFWLLATFFVTSSRFVLRRIAYQLRHRNYFVTPVIIIGTNEEAMALAEQLSHCPTSGVKVIGFISETRNLQIDKASQTEAIKNIPVLGHLDDLPVLVEQWGVQAIIAAITALEREQLLRVYEQLAEFPEVDLHLSSGLFEVLTTGVQVQTMESIPFVTLNRVRLEPLEMFVKTMIDYTIVLAGTIFLLPLFAILALVIRLDSPGPIFYRRRVMGMGGKSFDAFEFRTMHINGDEMLQRDYPELWAKLQANHQLKDDPRITRVGRWLRRFSMDELPLLFNVLLGQMSLVGPQMINPIELEKFGRQRMNLLTVKPGLTGLWQVSGRSDLTYEDCVRLDMYYINNYSIWMDLEALFVQTLPVVIKRRVPYYSYLNIKFETFPAECIQKLGEAEETEGRIGAHTHNLGGDNSRESYC